ncbi:glucose 1-dehydrogenase [Fructilactobacillus cliffordii]|uniref:glucose 1-dehydrogenase n=1 Tax=Fructilactobacillus cliffordii TaxID=2940299 RepID=UPI002091F91B|nr:glucose 1-dehydrogenase [Fructilactobacillus cliffordii]USS86889.1 glucose 1-dehydrogenase [Fructilactobacillus cliffordii]
MANRMKDKVAIITGGSKGIGYAVAEQFVEEGAKVTITCRKDDEGQAAVEKLNAKIAGSAKYLKQDVSNSKQWNEIFEETEKDFGPVTTLVNNAGIGLGKTIADTTDEEWNQVLAIDLNGVFYGLREAINQMRKHSIAGSIINMSSIEGIVGDPILGAYNASKGAVKMMTKSAALDCALKDDGIRVNSVHPGYIKTPMISADLEKAMSQRTKTPMGHLGAPEDIAYACVYLASDESKFTTGTELVVDGGYTAQ